MIGRVKMFSLLNKLTMSREKLKIIIHLGTRFSFHIFFLVVRNGLAKYSKLNLTLELS
jgi:hypothetical protein